MKKTIMISCVSIMLIGCSPDHKGADPHQEPPVLSYEDDPYDKNEGHDIADRDGLHINESKAIYDLHQGELSDELTNLISTINGIEYVKVIVHEQIIAAAVTHINGEDLENKIVQAIQDRVGEGYEIYVSKDKAAYRVAQTVDNGLRSGYDEKWEHDNMEELKEVMTKAT